MLVLDHVFHRKTNSFGFLFDVLSEIFDLEIKYVDPELEFPPDFDLECDYILICQLDFLTPFFLARNKRVIVVPMFDSSGGLPDSHWTYNRQASYLNFSLHLHVKALTNNCRSLLLKYCPDVDNYKKVDDFSTKRLFFWERLPSSPVNCRRVAGLIGNSLDKIHVHLPTDDGSVPATDLGTIFPTGLTTSTWFDDKADLDAVLDSCNIFVAPRTAEGIGQSFLEAMARGMVVLAYNLPTHNEYIKHLYNGILFNQDCGKIDTNGWWDFAPAIGAAARETLEMGYGKWNDMHEKIVRFVLDTKRSDGPKSAFFRRFASETMREYQQGSEAYIRKLDSNPFPVQVMAGWGTVTDEIEAAETRERCGTEGFNLLFGQNLNKHLLGSGWSVPETGHVWAVETLSSLAIEAPKAIERGLRIVIEARALMAKDVRVTLGAFDLGVMSLDELFALYAFDVPLDAQLDHTLLRFEVDNLDSCPPDLRLFAFMLRSIRLVPLDFDLSAFPRIS